MAGFSEVLERLFSAMDIIFPPWRGAVLAFAILVVVVLMVQTFLLRGGSADE